MILWNVKYHYLNCHEFVAFLALTFKFPCKYHIILIWIFNPTFHRGGGVHPTPPKVLVSRAFQSYLRDHKCWHNSWYLEFVLWNKKIFFFSFFIKHHQASSSIIKHHQVSSSNFLIRAMVLEISRADSAKKVLFCHL